jgi:hypothetical protein
MHKKLTVDFMDIWRIEGGKLRETWVIMDFMGLMVQLGAVPAPAGKQGARISCEARTSAGPPPLEGDPLDAAFPDGP